jgi:predicted PurR-regulated permease PerM
MRRTRRSQDNLHLLVLVSSVVIIAALYFAKVVLVPFALAILLAFILAPPVRWLERIHMPRLLAVLIVVLLSMAAVGSVGWVVTNQFVDATSQWPNYRTNIKNKIESIRKRQPKSLDTAAQAVQEISTDLKGTAAPAPVPSRTPGSQSAKIPGAAAATPSKPIPVEVVSDYLQACEEAKIIAFR